MTDRQRGRLHFLDSLRGFAAVYVVFFHALLVPSPNPVVTNDILRQAVHFGGTGVFLFFVISGFSLCLTMPRHERTGRRWVSYGVSRFFRIAPLFYFMLLLYSLFYLIRQGDLNMKGTLFSISFLFNLVPSHQEGIVWASWTIGVEMIFYLVFPFLYRLARPGQILATLAAMLLFAAMMARLPSSYTYWTFVGYLPLFVIGMWAFYAYDRLSRMDARHYRPAVIGVIGIAILVFCAVPDLAEKNVLLRVPIAVGYAFLLVGCGLAQPRILSSRVTTFFGEISYSLYLAHAPIIMFTSPLYPAIFARVGGDLAFLIYGLCVLFIATAVATVLHHAIERRGIELGRLALHAAIGSRSVRIGHI